MSALSTCLYSRATSLLRCNTVCTSVLFRFHCPHVSLHNTCCVYPRAIFYVCTVHILSPRALSRLKCNTVCTTVLFHVPLSTSLSTKLSILSLVPHPLHIVSRAITWLHCPQMSLSALPCLQCNTVCTPVLFHVPLFIVCFVQHCPHCLLVPFLMPVLSTYCPLVPCQG
jgi:hypothetical protein